MSEGVGRTGTLSDDDRRYMADALDLAGRGWGRVHPNPLVGCVIVRDGKVVGRGWHGEWGGDHAEVVALAEAGERTEGATLYVTLEPCDHHGKTPPCSSAIVAAGVARVVFGALDPGEESGGGAASIAAAGLEVVGPVFSEAEARAANPFFFHDHPDRPWVALKLAVSLDGRLAASPGVRTSISGPESNERVQHLRAGFDALVVGSNTVLADDPLLTVRGPLEPRVPPLRVVLDRSGRISSDARVVTRGDAETLVLTSSRSPEEWRAELTDRGVRVVVAETGPDGIVDVIGALTSLRREGVRSLLCEGGGRLGVSMLSAGAVDRLYMIVAPMLLGPGGVPAFPGPDGGPFPMRWRHVEPPTRRGDDLWLVYEPEGA